MLELGLEPVIRKMIGYAAGESEPVNLKTKSLSDQYDIAVLKSQSVLRSSPPLSLSSVIPKPGDEIILLGYPTGLRALLARVSIEFVQQLNTTEKMDIWSLASELANEGLIRPLASRGIINQVSNDAVVYDAETAQGGSGGPVLILNGEVIAINTAIMSEFGGSNLGIPIKYARELLGD